MSIGRTRAAAADPTKVILRRCLQALIDGLLVTLASAVVAVTVLVLLAWVFRVPADPAAWITVGCWIATLLLGGPLNEIVVAHRLNGATIGMKLLGLRIVRLDGGPPSRRTYSIRYLLWLADGFFWCLAGLVTMCCTQQRQRLGDLVAGTVVVRRSSVDQLVLPRPDSDLGPVPEPQLALRAGQMGLDGRQ